MIFLMNPGNMGVSGMRAPGNRPLREAWMIFFFLGIVMLNYPFLHIFNKNALVFGIPLILIYLLIGWPLSIVVIYIFSLYLGRGSDGEEPPPEDPGEESP